MAKLLACTAAHLFDAEQQHHRERDGKHGKKRGERAIAERLHRKARERSDGESLALSCTPRWRTTNFVEDAQPASVKRVPKKLFLVAHHDDSRAGLIRFGQRADRGNASWRLRSSAEVGSSATMISGAPINASSRRSSTLLLTDAERARWSDWRNSMCIEAEDYIQQATRFSFHRAALRCTPRPHGCRS
ncbi:hypothetical protein [Hyphomicrobium sp. D-2]|uniref:hypothetical protein n=1 Tax=Hyphomicrobium sp. D-2 TaxID=3041621 RepID=UPI002456FFB5|nr:hypothetical protein [Hyphomicrobium sp. D-2]MDH4983161.1 hypothetical protein [Hyphomicrobium sp. D-2]